MAWLVEAMGGIVSCLKLSDLAVRSFSATTSRSAPSALLVLCQSARGSLPTRYIVSPGLQSSSSPFIEVEVNFVEVEVSSTVLSDSSQRKAEPPKSTRHVRLPTYSASAATDDPYAAR